MTLHVKPIDREWDEAVRLRTADEAECLAGGMESALAVRSSIRQSTNAFAAYDGEELLAVWGWAHRAPGSAYVWLLTTPAVDRVPLAFGRLTVRLFLDLSSRFPALYVLCHTPHTKARRWLTWLGFMDAEVVGEFALMTNSKGPR